MRFYCVLAATAVVAFIAVRAFCRVAHEADKAADMSDLWRYHHIGPDDWHDSELERD